MDSDGLGWTRLNSLKTRLDLAGLGWTQVDSSGLRWTRMDSVYIYDSLGRPCVINSIGLIRTLLDSIGSFKHLHKNSIGLYWTHLVPNSF